MPIHEHDCERCVFLGSSVDESDWYVCDQGIGHPTIVRRYGEDGDYESSISMLHRVPKRFQDRARALLQSLKPDDSPTKIYVARLSENQLQALIDLADAEAVRLEDDEENVEANADSIGFHYNLAQHLRDELEA